jgi:hypothetical protein
MTTTQWRRHTSAGYTWTNKYDRAIKESRRNPRYAGQNYRRSEIYHKGVQTTHVVNRTLVDVKDVYIPDLGADDNLFPCSPVLWIHRIVLAI